MKNKAFCSQIFSATSALLLLGASQGLAAILSLADALDTTNLTWTTTDAYPWIAQTNVSHDGFDAAQIQRAYSSLETSVTGPVRLSFWWMLWREWPYDDSHLRLYLDEQLLAIIDETSDWSPGLFNISPGTHVLRWSFENYSEGPIGDMAWLDEVRIDPISDNSGPPVIFWQPPDKNAALGTTVFFTNLAGGSPPLSYQWQFEGVDLPDATNAVLVLSNVQFTNAGNYTVRVTNALGTALSSNMLLTVAAHSDFTDALDDPTLNWETGGEGIWARWYVENEITHDGVDAAESGQVEEYLETWLQTTVLGPGVINFWWKFQWRSEEGYMAFSIDNQGVWGISHKQVDWEPHSFAVPAGVHTLRWTMSAGADDAFLDQVRFDPNGPYAPTITKAPPAHAAALGDDLLLRVEVAGTEPFTYQWRVNGQSLPGANSATLILTNIQPGQAGNYSVSVSNVAGGLITAPVPVTVGPMLLDWAWVRQMGGTGDDTAGWIQFDSSGHMYFGGYFESNATFGNIVLTNPPGTQSSFLAKYDSAGQPMWVQPIIGGDLDALVVDSGGNLYMCGFFWGSVRLGATNLVANNGLFVAKCDPDGNFLWVRQVTNIVHASYIRTSLALNANGNLYLAAAFWGTTMLGTFTLTTGTQDILLARYDSSGNVIWVKTAGGTVGTNPMTRSLATDSLGNAYLSGSFFQTLNFGTTNLTSPGYGGFLAKYDAGGNVAWVKQAQANEGSYMTLAVDPADNLLVHNEFADSITLGTNHFYYFSDGSANNAYLAKLTPSGEVLWARAFQGHSGALNLDASGNIYLSGSFAFSLLIEDQFLSNHLYDGLFVAKFDPEGHVVWLKKADAIAGADVAVTAAGEVYLAGGFRTFVSPPYSPQQTVALFGTNALVSYGGPESWRRWDAFLAKLSPVPPPTLTLADALDTTNVSWLPTAWLPQTNLTHDGVDAAWGEISPYFDNPVLATAVTGPVRLSFWWRCLSPSLEYATPLAFYLDRELITSTSLSDWLQVSFSVPPGTHTLRWLFEAYELRVGDAALVDEVTIEPIDDTTGPAMITGQPLNKTAGVGTTVFFKAFAGGSPPLYLQWLFEGNPIPGATNALLVLRNVQLSDAGRYCLQVTNALGATVSSNAVLTVNPTGALTEALDDPTLNWRGGWGAIGSDGSHDGIDAASGGAWCNELATLETTVIGPGSLSFWWKGHSRDCDGHVGFSSDYGLNAGYAGDFDWEHHSFAVPAGIHTFHWEVFAGPECVGAGAWLDQVSFDPNGPYPPTIVNAPGEQAVSQGDDILWSVTVEGTEPLYYQWYFNGQALPGETAARLMLTNVQPSHAGNYSVSISNVLQTITSPPAALTVGPMRLIWEWVRWAGGGHDYTRYVTVDNVGYIYVAGCFTNILTLGTNVLISSGRDDIFVAKYDSGGNALKAFRMGGTSNDYPHGITVDAGGNVYVSGILNIASGRGDLFLAKYDANGNLLWRHQPGKVNYNYNEERSCIALDSAGNVYLGATFYGTVTLGSYSFTPAQSTAFFLAKFDSAGNVLWAKSPACPSSSAMFSLVVDQLSNVYLSGRFTQAIDFAVTNLLAIEPSWYGNAFIAKYDSAGNIGWVQQNPANTEWRVALGIDPANNLIMRGGFEGAVTLGTNVFRMPFETGSYQGYLAKCDPSGQMLWARVFRALASLDPQLAVDSTGSIYMMDDFLRYMELDGHVLFAPGDGLAVIKIDSEGQVQWLKRVNPYGAGGMELAVSAAGDIYTASPFSVAKLTPRSRPRLDAQLQIGTPGIRLGLTSEIGRIYAIETSTDFHTWTPLVTVTNLTGEIRFADPDPTLPAQRFYRAREQ